MTEKHAKKSHSPAIDLTEQGSVVKFVSARGRPVLLVPGKHLHYCDENHIPILIVWKRTVYADVTWLNDSLVLIHRDLFEREEFRRDIEDRAEKIYEQYAANSKRAARAITHHFMTLYDLKAEDAEKAACDLFDMTMDIIQEYRNKERRP
ncbi:hypothetical protein VXS29_06715 [Escherichia coli]|uniref:Uncharacterized protein n=3 Tax=Escherichia coli TaxID=562 RepID=A0A376D2A8_ECOLX|nr:hypothetical protein [Escherichia coli]ODQ12354.1 hypothetical protein BGK51_20910 [Shigella sp. FC569]EAB5457890.1 hypothetical protein [Escherichia coli]EFA6268167.1 hypothetical protein [Escherichia coli]EFE0070346.1 hypothetical protein [Escherichia coli]EFI7814561.1 hypothetical protein [Escherichia coli]